jgi:hypothetical protein
MRGFEQVSHLVDNDVFEAFPRFSNEIGIQSNRTHSVIATTPFRLHPLDEESAHAYPHQPLPFLDHWRDGIPQLLTLPFFKDFLPLRHVRAMTYTENHSAVDKLDGRWLIGLNNFQQIPLPPDVVRFPIDVFPGGLAFLFLQLSLLSLYPGQFCNREDADGVEAHMPRGGNAHPSGRWVDAQMDILDVLSNDIHANVTELDPCPHQYSC